MRYRALGATGVPVSTSVAQLALAWVLRDPVVTCALVGPKRPAQMAEAMAAADLELSDAEIAAMDRLVDGNEPPLGAFDARKSRE
jgi:aryl-alcohol dehydrogenase-like predicted oxidoreductase